MEFVNKYLIEKRRREELVKKNAKSKQRLQQLAGQSTTTQWSGNIKELAGVSKAVTSILDPNIAEKEYEQLLNSWSINVAVIDARDIKNEILGDHKLDPYYIRLFSRYTEIILNAREVSVEKLSKRPKPEIKFS